MMLDLEIVCSDCEQQGRIAMESACRVLVFERAGRTTAKKRKGEKEKEISVSFDLAVVSVDFPEFQPSYRLHFWTASSSHTGELIQQWV
ncbi:hypothetical protein E3N88_12913 [Mikania micrantha]|uniref:Uncharacterized protein n=1 Tax=Mikania micrantha TaxID=192012 RepID=A0A5N6P8V4_9ASTR|nr:hypothetical protein E3N88_12913 [Mikania micrantha]